MKNKLKERKGITLIALVITIIILLILASVSIAMLTGDNGILTQANKAKNETEIKNKEEQEKLNNASEIIESIGLVRIEVIPPTKNTYKKGTELNTERNDSNSRL